MKGNFYKKTSRYGGYTRAELWCYGSKSKIRKTVKTDDSRTYRRYRKNAMRKDLESTGP